MPADDLHSPARAYDELAATYTDDIESNAYNAQIVFPAVTDLLGDVSGARLLDAGCGTGAYTTWLTDQGAEVVGVDCSTEMLARARNRLDGDGDVLQADLNAPLGFADNCFDGIVSVLAVSYIRDWNALFREFARICRAGGTLLIATTHPFDEFGTENEDAQNYFDIERCTKSWDVEIPYFRRPLEAMIQPILDAGFAIESVVEPQPTAAFAEQRPDRYPKESRQPVFFCLNARRRKRSSETNSNQK